VRELAHSTAQHHYPSGQDTADADLVAAQHEGASK
jgi:hypothetical protein